MTRDTKATIGRPVAFFGGCVPASPEEAELAYSIGHVLGSARRTLLHGGYNGLMEQAARGCRDAGGRVVAVTLANVDWGEFNPYVDEVKLLPDAGARLGRFLNCDLVVAMGGGVGTLHELTAALWHATNLRSVPVWLAGPTALRLLDFLIDQRWLFESPTRSLAFLRRIDDLDTFQAELLQFLGDGAATATSSAGGLL